MLFASRLTPMNPGIRGSQLVIHNRSAADQVVENFREIQGSWITQARVGPSKSSISRTEIGPRQIRTSKLQTNSTEWPVNPCMQYHPLKEEVTFVRAPL